MKNIFKVSNFFKKKFRKVVINEIHSTNLIPTPGINLIVHYFSILIMLTQIRMRRALRVP